MKIEVLLSCMNRTDIESLVESSNIQTDVVVVNQTDHNSHEVKFFLNKDGEKCQINVFNTTERGLSRSRNVALKNAKGDICIVCDDDERFEDDYHKMIIENYKKHNGYSVLCFEVRNRRRGRNIGIFEEKRLNRLTIFKICSVQITFLREAVQKHNIHFNVNLGAGVTKAGGEEHKFLKDCLTAGLKIINIPQYLTAIDDSESTWWKGFSREYFFDKGQSSRLTMGLPLAMIYAVYTLVFKHKDYKQNCSFAQAASSLYRGIFTKLKDEK